MKYILFFGGILLLIAPLKLSSTYYHFLRITISTISILYLYLNLKKEFDFKNIIFGTTLILFNPIFPIYFYTKKIWTPIDFLIGIFFILMALKTISNHE